MLDKQKPTEKAADKERVLARQWAAAEFGSENLVPFDPHFPPHDPMGFGDVPFEEDFTPASSDGTGWS